MSARVGIALLPICALMLAIPAAGARAQAVNDSAMAQTTPATSPAPAVPFAPTAALLAVGVQRQNAHGISLADPALAARGAGLGQAEALMIVGGAAILVGAIVEGDGGRVIMVGGAIVGLIGLYKYLQ